MKKLLTFALILSCALFACQQKTAEEMKREADSIKLSTFEGQRDSLMYLIGDISQNIIEVNRLENIITQPDFSHETAEMRKEVFANIERLEKELEKRKEQLDSFEKFLNRNGKINPRIKADIATQRFIIETQGDKVIRLGVKLAEANKTITNLTNDVKELNTEVNIANRKRDIAERQTQKIDEELNACFFVVGTRQELKDHKILDKKLFGKAKILENDFDRSYFVRADKRTLKEIATYSQKAKILTNQPSSSYEVIEENHLKVIKITDPTLFWEKSNFLVVETK